MCLHTIGGIGYSSQAVCSCVQANGELYNWNNCIFHEKYDGFKWQKVYISIGIGGGRAGMNLPLKNVFQEKEEMKKMVTRSPQKNSLQKHNDY